MPMSGWSSSGVHIVTNEQRQVALVDNDINILVGPFLLSDAIGVSTLTEWLFGYLTDTTSPPHRKD